MTRLLPAMIVLMFMTLVFGERGNEEFSRRRHGVVVISRDQFFQWLCSNSINAAWLPICGSSTTTTTVTTTTARTTRDTSASTSTESSTRPATRFEQESTRTSTAPSTSTTDRGTSMPPSTSTADRSTSMSPSTSTADRSTSMSPSTSTADRSTSMSASALERAHWCRFDNGTYVPYLYTFMHTECALCQCTPSHEIWCTTLQCMPTYCIDGSTPAPRQGQCCAQCTYEKASTACVINDVSFPHGTVLRQTNDNIQCWCQLGSVECRKGTTTLFSGLDWWGKGSAVYVIVIIICAVLLIGILLCCASTLFFYRYYQRQQRNIQNAYAEYYNSAGWQAMPGDQEVVEGSAEEKQAEAEQEQVEYERSTGISEQQYVPPPYALYNGSYVNEPSGKDWK